MEKKDENDETKDSSKVNEDIITTEMLNKDIQLKEAVDILKALVIMKGQ